MKIIEGDIEREMTEEELEVFEKNQRRYELQNKLDEESNVQGQLNDTDYKIIKTVEYVIVELLKKGSILLKGIELPYDITQLSENRDQLRSQINDIRKEIQQSEDENIE